MVRLSKTTNDSAFFPYTQGISKQQRIMRSCGRIRLFPQLDSEALLVQLAARGSDRATRRVPQM